MEDLNNVDFCFPKYDPKINKNLKKNMTNINSKDLINLSYNNSEWKKLYFNNTNKLKLHFNKEKFIFELKFKLKNLLYKLKSKFI